MAVEEKVRAAMGDLIADMNRQIDLGSRPIGWKVGVNDAAVQKQLQISDSVAGYMLESSLLTRDTPKAFRDGARVLVEPEIAIYLGQDVEPGAAPESVAAAIAGIGPALEVIDFAQPIDSLEAVLAHNIFHHSVCFAGDSPPRVDLSLDSIRVTVEGSDLETLELVPSTILPSIPSIVQRVFELIQAHGVGFHAGDRIISGSLCRPIPIHPGGTISARFGELGALSIRRDEHGGVLAD